MSSSPYVKFPCRVPLYVEFPLMSSSPLCRVPPYVEFPLMSSSPLCRVPPYVEFPFMLSSPYVKFPYVKFPLCQVPPYVKFSLCQVPPSPLCSNRWVLAGYTIYISTNHHDTHARTHTRTHAHTRTHTHTHTHREREREREKYNCLERKKREKKSSVSKTLHIWHTCCWCVCDTPKSSIVMCMPYDGTVMSRDIPAVDYNHTWYSAVAYYIIWCTCSVL